MDKSSIPYWVGLRNQISYRAHQRREPITCASGEETTSYLDLKSLFTHSGAMLHLAEAMRIYRRQLGIPLPTAVGGPTMGADFMAFSIAVAQVGIDWFSVRDKPKDHGLQKLIEGAELDEFDKGRPRG
ncbi:hypothetical protein DQP57_00220 [Mycobacterium colombiense]|uniref:Uncharacterized protein n=1 Tax=Mycobacterium colombiense TaxID=339268 RepID=A0A329MIS0_9MYCO|nr:hypothetical protein [Mycobacterium colombiense]RAV17487.1 hypothetical protein DQP57_00220 [Mycobacterium colombiense]